MNEKDLFDAIGKIDDKYILECSDDEKCKDAAKELNKQDTGNGSKNRIVKFTNSNIVKYILAAVLLVGILSTAIVYSNINLGNQLNDDVYIDNDSKTENDFSQRETVKDKNYQANNESETMVDESYKEPVDIEHIAGDGHTNNGQGSNVGIYDGNVPENGIEGVLKLPENEIILVYRYINYAWGYNNEGYFVNSNGEIYSFNIGVEDDDKQKEYDGLMDIFHDVEKESKPIAVVDEASLKEIYRNSLMIDSSKKIEEKHVSFDAGCDYVMINKIEEKKLVICRETGDVAGELKSDEAKNILNIFDNVIGKQINDNNDSN